MQVYGLAPRFDPDRKTTAYKHRLGPFARSNGVRHYVTGRLGPCLREGNKKTWRKNPMFS